MKSFDSTTMKSTWITPPELQRTLGHFDLDTNKECADEYKSKLNREVEELRKENALLHAAMKPILECKVMSAMTAEIEPGRSDYCAAIIEKAQRIYNKK